MWITKNHTHTRILNNHFFIFFKEPSRVLREALRSSLPIKDRLMIKLENDMRYGEVRFDHWLLHAKVNIVIMYFIIYYSILKSLKYNLSINIDLFT